MFGTFFRLIQVIFVFWGQNALFRENTDLLEPTSEWKGLCLIRLTDVRNSGIETINVFFALFHELLAVSKELETRSAVSDG